jgi:hypothetical protein
MDTSGITPTPAGTPKIPGEGQGGGGLQAAITTPVKTLGDLKNLLISNLGPQQGTKLYNTFLKSIAMAMLAPLRTAQQQAQQAVRQMRSQDKYA